MWRRFILIPTLGLAKSQSNILLLFYEKHESKLPCPTRLMHEHFVVTIPRTLPIIDFLYFIKLFLGCLAVLNMIIWFLFFPIKSVKYARFNCNMTCSQRSLIPNPPLPITSLHLTFIAIYLNETEIFLPLFFHVFDELFLWILTLSFRSPLLTSPNLINLVILYQLSLMPTLLTLTSFIKFLISTLDLLCPTPPIWFTFLKILLSNDIERNPGDFRENFFTFCNWNINSLAKDTSSVFNC